jgi:2-phospho-L-lactate guanylyltransferase (CobY/MobA/RfbA family)
MKYNGRPLFGNGDQKAIIRVLVPYDSREPKTRLADILTTSERRAFTDTMLQAAVAAVRDAGADQRSLSTAMIDADVCSGRRQTTALTRGQRASEDCR